MGYNKVVQKLRGADGSQVTLTIKRKSQDKPLEKIVTCGKILAKQAAAPLGRRSLIYAAKSEFEKASKDAEEAFALDPNNIWSKRAISWAYIFKGSNLEEALKLLSTSQANFDRLLEALAYAKMGEPKRSAEIYGYLPEEYLASKNLFRQHFKKIVLESLDSYKTHKKDIGQSLEAKGQYREALKEYGELLPIAEEREAKEVRTHVGMIIKNRPYLMACRRKRAGIS